MSYSLDVYGSSSHAHRVLLLQKRAVRGIEGVASVVSCRPLFRKHKILTVFGAYVLNKLIETKKSLQVQQKDVHQHNTRQKELLRVPFCRLNTTAFMKEGSIFYNLLPDHWKPLQLKEFRRKIHDYLIENPPYSLMEFMDTIKERARYL